MPLSGNPLEQQQQQQGSRPTPRPQGAPIPLSLHLVHLLALSLLVALAPCPCPGLKSSGDPKTNWASANLRYDQWKSSRPSLNGTVEEVLRGRTSEISVPQGRAFQQSERQEEKRHRETTQARRERLINLDSAQSLGEPISSSSSSSLRSVRSAEGFWGRGELDTFSNSHILRLDIEQVRHIKRRETRRFSFTIKSPTQLEVYLTPCSSNVSWSFTSSGRGYLSNQRIHRVPLFSYEGHERRSFSKKLMPNVYHLDVKSLSSRFDSRVFIYLNTRSQEAGGSGHLYPSLPTDSTVRVQAEDSRNTRSLKIQWQPAAPRYHGLRLEYCLVVSRIKNFPTHCAASAFAKGVEKPRDVSWGGSSDFRRPRKHQRNRARPVKAESTKRIFYTCVGNKTSFTYTENIGGVKLRGGKRYFIDVFVRDLDTDASSPYTGIRVRFKRKTRYFMGVGDSRSFKLRPRRRPKVEITLNGTYPKFILEITSCQGKTPIRIYRNDQRIRERRVSRYKQIVIPNEPPGKFVVTFPVKKRKRKRETSTAAAAKASSLGANSSVRKRRRKRTKSGSSFVTLSVLSRRSSIKKLPRDLSVSFLHYLSGCQNVTLAWPAAGQNYTYCVYSRRMGRSPHSVKEIKDVCRAAGDDPRHTRQAGCITHPVIHPDTDVITYNVHDLDPGICYRFDVLITRPGLVSVPYDGVRVKTPDDCENSKPLTHKDFKCSRRTGKINGANGNNSRRRNR